MQGGHAIVQFKSAFCDENSAVRSTLAPGPLREACGFYYQEFSSIDKISLKDNPFEVKDNTVDDWMEFLILETAKPLAYYDHPYFNEYPAITLNKFGKGSLLYEGTLVSNDIQKAIIIQSLERAGIKNENQAIQWPLVVKTSENEKGKRVHFLYNYSSAIQELIYPHNSGLELLTNKKVAKDEKLQLPPWEVLVIEEK